MLTNQQVEIMGSSATTVLQRADDLADFILKLSMDTESKGKAIQTTRELRQAAMLVSAGVETISSQAEPGVVVNRDVLLAQLNSLGKTITDGLSNNDLAEILVAANDATVRLYGKLTNMPPLKETQ